ncbi:MAG: ABC transporter ATP-binding protein [Pseudomonadota bacterium]
MITVDKVEKRYAGGFQALRGVSLEIAEGEIIALLGPNGAGKTTLISIICGLSTLSAGKVLVGGHDVVRSPRAARQLVGLVPQEISLDLNETVWNSVRLSRGLFGLPHDPAILEDILKKLSLWDKRDEQSTALSGGMKRRVMIAKALVHEPRVLFLDEPTAGVDVELRKDMWDVVSRLKQQGVTIILTTHYIEEAEAIADRIGVISNGEILLVEETGALLQRMGQKEMTLELQTPLEEIPSSLADYKLELTDDPCKLVYRYDTRAARTGISRLLGDLSAAGVRLRDVQTKQSSLEDIFVELVKKGGS